MRMKIIVFATVLLNLANLTGGQQNGEIAGLQRTGNNKDGRQSIYMNDLPDDANVLAKTDETKDQVKIQYVNVNGLPVLVQFTYVGPPKILPIATADSYPEGSSINLICTVSGGQRRGLELSWTLNNQPLDEKKLKYSGANVAINTDEVDISILRIKNATDTNSGVYTCNAKNPLGQDSTSVKININVELRWNKLPKDVEVALNQEVSIECDAIGFPVPTIEWIKHSPSVDNNKRNGTTNLQPVSKGKLLKLSRTQHRDSGLYECVARNGVDEDLRKVIQVKVRGKYKISQ